MKIVGSAEGWLRVAQHVVARRHELGFKSRLELAGASRLAARTLSDIEVARRTNYIPSTIAALENALKWAPGSIARILEGSAPMPVAVRLESKPAVAPADEALIRVMNSDISNADKARIVQTLLAEQQRFLRRRAEELLSEVRDPRSRGGDL